MDELQYVYATAGVMVLYFIWRVATGRFDPFAPVWMFFVGYVQVYVIQPISFHDWAVGVRGVELVTAANQRALWALLWFLAAYHLGPGRLLSRWLPTPPRGWSAGTAAAISPVLIVWGILSAGFFGGGAGEVSAEGALLRSFPFVMMVAAILLIVTGGRVDEPRRGFLVAGLAVASGYMLIWLLNGKRSHSLMAVLTTVCAMYVTRFKRPSWPVLGAIAFTGALAVALAIGWRNTRSYERSLGGFAQFVVEFDPSTILVSMDVVGDQEDVSDEFASYETKEYGGFLLMLDTVPEKSDYDYGQSYLRTFSTFIPRIVWPSKPLYGRKEWVGAWIAGSEFKRDEEFTGPAIGILGATQLNGGAVGTLVVLAVAASFLRMLYEFFLRHAASPWAQFFWSVFFFNAWFMVVNDDPMIWFYYNWGLSAFPTVTAMWFVAKFAGGPVAEPRPTPTAVPAFGTPR
mgnify:CR=1 FL=1